MEALSVFLLKHLWLELSVLGCGSKIVFFGKQSYYFNERGECGYAIYGYSFEFKPIRSSSSFRNNTVKFLWTVLLLQSFLCFILTASEIAHYGSNKENYLRTGYAGSLFLRRSSSHIWVSGQFVNLSVSPEMLQKCVLSLCYKYVCDYWAKYLLSNNERKL